jgi:hypothetical protein
MQQKVNTQMGALYNNSLAHVSSKALDQCGTLRTLSPSFPIRLDAVYNVVTGLLQPLLPGA